MASSSASLRKASDQPVPLCPPALRCYNTVLHHWTIRTRQRCGLLL